MSEVERSALVNYSATQMYDLVSDVDSYADFLPGCVSSKILEQHESKVIGLMELKKGPVSQTLTTENILVPGESIAMELKDGPFEYLNGCWSFKSLTDSACKVELKLSFKFSNKLAAVAFNKMFEELTLKLVDSFVTRAGEIYG